MIERLMLTKAVQEILDRNPSWTPALVNDLISPNKVAKKVLAQVALLTGRPVQDVRVNSVVKAVEAYMKKIGKTSFSDLERVKRGIAQSQLSLITGLTVLEVRPKRDLDERLARIMRLVYKGDRILYVNMGKLNTSLLFSSTYAEQIRLVFNPDEILDMYGENTGILIETPDLALYNPMTYDSYLLNLLASHDIPLAWYSSASTETLIVVNEKNAVESFQIIKDEIQLLTKGLKPRT